MRETPRPVGFTWFSGAKLRAARTRAGMSRNTLARRIDFLAGTQTIMRYETGRTVPTTNTALAMARALDIALEDLTDA